MPAMRIDLDYLLAPTTREDFFARHWEREPMVVARREPERFAHLLGVGDLDFVVAGAFQLQPSMVELLGEEDGRSLKDTHRAARVADVYEAYRRGATVRVNGVQQLLKPFRLLCRELEQTFSFPVKANLYATPAEGLRSPRHYDKHDVFVLQLAGHKRWRVYRPVEPLPLSHAPALPFEDRDYELKRHRGGRDKSRADIKDEECGAPTDEFTLGAGDTLYLPRGFVHEAWALEESSLHVTVGVHVLTWMHLLGVALGQVSNRDERLRRALPVGFANETAPGEGLPGQFAEILRAFSEGVSLEQALGETAWSFIVNTQSVGDGSLAESRDAGGVGVGSLVRRRPGLLWGLVFEGGNVGLASSHNVLWMPGSFAEAMRFIAREVEFRVAEIPGQLSDKSKLALTSRLVRDGFLTVVREE